jgi:glycosyltransferase involved in cell wall biosynthesis
MQQPLVSVVMAVKNGERFLAAGLDSVAAQSYRNFEIVVVDGHSTDRSAAIAAAYPQARFITQDGAGLSAAWNTGVRAARGELIAFLDHDDLWAPHKLDAQVAHLLAHPEAQYVVAQVRFFLEPGCAVPPGFKPELFGQDLMGRIPGTLMARRALFAQLGDFNEGLKIAGDVEWFVRAKDRGVAMGYVPEVLLHKRIHEANLAADALANSRELLSLLRESINRQRRGRAKGDG